MSQPEAAATDPDLIRVFLTEAADDKGNANCAHKMFGDRFLYCEAIGWLYWTGTHWKLDEAEAQLELAIFAMLRARRMVAVSADKEAIVKATLGTARRMRDCKVALRSMATVPVSTFDHSPDELNVANGVLNLRTGELTPHSPTCRFTYCTVVEYDPAADDTPWRDFLTANVGGGPDMVDYLQMAVGYSLTGHTAEECLWYVFGPTRSGKGTFSEVLLDLLGAPLSVEVDFATFTARREGDTQNFDLAPLKPTRLVVTSESNRNEVLNAGKVKQLTGGNYIRCAFKHRDLFVYRPQFKAWLVSNHPVNADVDDDALWYRVKVVEFPHSYKGMEDKTLKRKMKTAAVTRGVLKWAVAGAQRWYRAKNGLQHPSWVNLATAEHRRELDFVATWLDETCEERPDAWTPNSLLYANYEEWCKANGAQPKSARGLALALKAKAFSVGEVRKIDGRAVRGVKGLLLRYGR